VYLGGGKREDRTRVKVHENRDLRGLTGIRVAATAVAAMILAGCGTTRTGTAAAKATFATSHPGCRATVLERSDLAAERLVVRSRGQAYEVTGCNADVIYVCSNYTNPHNWHYGPAECSESGWCTPDGCDSFGLAARRAFVKDRSCSIERVIARPRSPVLSPAPPNVAADSESLRIWTQTQQEKVAGHTFLTVTGCESETVYDCTKPSGTRAIPICTPATQSPPAR
jgi:hypothetical protein